MARPFTVIPFEDLQEFLHWLHTRRFIVTPDREIAALIMKRAMNRNWTNPGSKRFWYIHAGITLREAGLRSSDNDLVQHLTETAFVVFDYIDRTDKNDQALLVNILQSRRLHSKVTIAVPDDPMMALCGPDLRKELDFATQL